MSSRFPRSSFSAASRAGVFVPICPVYVVADRPSERFFEIRRSMKVCASSRQRMGFPTWQKRYVERLTKFLASDIRSIPLMRLLQGICEDVCHVPTPPR